LYHYSAITELPTLSLHDALPILTTAVNGQALFFEGQRPPQQITFAGTLIDKAHYDALDWWTYNTGRITITDHFRRKLSVVLTDRSEEHTSELQSRENLVCRLLLE